MRTFSLVRLNREERSGDLIDAKDERCCSLMRAERKDEGSAVLCCTVVRVN